MYIDKKTIPEIIRQQIDMRLLTKLLKDSIKEYETFEYTINYNNEYLIDLELTYEYHKTRGVKWACIEAKRIYKIDNDRLYSYSLTQSKI